MILEKHVVTVAPEDEARFSWFIRVGQFFGYPECCINAFINKVCYGVLTEAQEAVHNNNGFIPCHTCAITILRGITTIDKLIDTDARQCARQYPFGTIDNIDSELNA